MQDAVNNMDDLLKIRVASGKKSDDCPLGSNEEDVKEWVRENDRGSKKIGPLRTRPKT